MEELRTPEEILEDNGYDIETLQEEQTILYRNPDFSTAIIGISDDYRIVYDYNKMIEHLITYDGFTEEEAIEWIDYNTLRAYCSEGQMPIVMYSIEQ
jgi:hypothetical protein